ncbi:PREDICTED: transmembrane protein 33-like isoform X1 [Amphimedon queenslandica]|uniref:Transmembrane protein 33 n=1 Tax=Amphimedon queenslandica TaxID=400682 RepID=A0A1X7TWR4_AMPQE|nr:PREDICTED: transmembrane protein 33-like isoform X1 [Amphimedon queenslandica]XP_019857400.1 PREDICTED: transmembrane protein 33-like isoform X1 [Amphimedon queenslandica]|eukprot:XP_019857399.1 PREDICTED: transmembrane protein 33-like isoform X1 [Amphimedon queenslandica]
MDNSLMDHVKANRSKSLQFLLRIITLTCGLLFILSGIIVSPYTGVSSYYYAFLSSLLTFGIQLNKRMTENQVSLVSRAFINLLVTEDSGHYVLYSFFFYNQYPNIIHLFPIVLYAFLGIARFMQEIHQLVSPSVASKLLVISRWASVNQSPVHRFIAYCEVFTFPIMLWEILAGHMFILAPLFYYNFLKMRYTSRRNGSVRMVFSELHTSACFIAAHRNCPTIISSVIYKMDSVISRLNPIVTTTTPPPPPRTE